MASDAQLSDPEDKAFRGQYAKTLCDIGLEQILEGKVDLAIDSLEESIRQQPSAENYTFRGWAASIQGQLSQAIAYCRKAIKIDPQFGNPYNDIGVYLMKLGRFEEAKSWLERAKKAENYEPRHFPYLNMGRIFMIHGEQNQALAEYVQALELDPKNAMARAAIAEMEMDFY